MIKRTFPIRFGSIVVALATAALLVQSCGGGDGVGGGPLPSPGGGPIATITAPVDFTANITGGLVIQATAIPVNSAVASVEFQVDGAAVGTATSAPYSAAVSTTNYASGQHVVRARAVDTAGTAGDWAAVTVHFGGTRTQGAGFSRNENFVTGLTAATAFAQAPAPDGRLFIAEQGGTLRVVAGGSLQPTPFVTLNVDSQGERGLLGVALHPDFASNNLVYVYYTATTPTVHNRVSRFTASGNVAAAGSEQVLLDLPALSATNHNGGAIHFGADRKLYVGVGDNAVRANSQDLSTPLGKMLRLNEDGSIPGDNPFCTTPGNAACAIWARGLRNPFTFAVQPSTGRIHINDVGEVTWEEINLGTAGANYGWPNSEGPSGVTTGVTAPIFAYNHNASAPPGSGPGGFFTGAAITGGTFYPGGAAFGAPYAGGYFFADLSTRFVAFLDLAANNAAYAFGSVTGNPVDLLAANDGALLVLTRSNVVRFSKP